MVPVFIARVVEAPSTNCVIHNPVDGLWNESADRAESETIERGARDGVVPVNRSENTTHQLLMANVVSIHAQSLINGVVLLLAGNGEKLRIDWPDDQSRVAYSLCRYVLS